MKRIAISLVALLVPACLAAPDEDVEDSIDARASGKADSIVEGSAEAAAILSLVNDPRISRQQLDEDGGLSSRVATSIVALRDAETIDDVAELDALPYVGSRTLAKLAEYAARVIPPPTVYSNEPGRVILTEDTTWSPSMGTILAGSTEVPAGVTLTITAGTLLEEGPTNTLNIKGTLVIKGVRSAPVNIVGDTREERWNGIYQWAGSHVVMSHASIAHSNFGIDANEGNNDTTLTNVSVDGFGLYAIRAGAGTKLEIDGYVARNTSVGDGLVVGPGATATVRNALMAHTGPIKSYGMLTFENATVIANVMSDDSSRTIIRNSIIVGELVLDINTPAALDMQLDHVLLWHSTGEDQLPPTGLLIHGDPAFVSETDFHLRSSSPAIDAGTAGSDHDLAGNPRDDEPDLGAYELVRP